MSDNRFNELWTDYLEGELDDSGVSELRQLLTDERLLKLAADTYEVHRLLGVAASPLGANEEFVQETLARLPSNSDQFASAVMGQLQTAKTGSSRWQRYRWLAAAAAIAALAAVAWRPSGRDAIEANRDKTAPQALAVRLAGASHARFFGELAPQVDAALQPSREYVMTEGLVELAFPSGASVIIESPAVFRILSETSLALDTGRCSVHAPDGAEGFRVETPVTRIVDRGTRFSVNVAESSETEVQVVEGIADVYRRDEPAAAQHNALPSPNSDEPPPEVRLTEREARRFANSDVGAVTASSYNPDSYRSRLPDRIITYEATSAVNGGAEHLKSITVQRGGKVRTYAVNELIPVELTWFKSADAINRSGHLAGGRQLSNPRGDLLADTTLNTGVINPGGQPAPLTSDPVMSVPEDPKHPNTPGLAVRFRAPVINGPGADVVFFDLQALSNPSDGDAFHVSPLRFAPGHRSHTVRAYDLTMTSPEALRLADFSLYRFATPIRSLVELETASATRASPGTRFHALAVGIDLSDLGFQSGEQVEGLFFQDAADDEHLVDPVFIGGLPIK